MLSPVRLSVCLCPSHG